MLYPYPGDFPSAAVWQLIGDALAGKPFDKKEASHATWHAVGFGLSQWDDHAPLGAAAAVNLTDEAASILAYDLAHQLAVGMAFPWQTLQLLMPVLLKLLDRLLR